MGEDDSRWIGQGIHCSGDAVDDSSTGDILQFPWNLDSGIVACIHCLMKPINRMFCSIGDQSVYSICFECSTMEELQFYFNGRIISNQVSLCLVSGCLSFSRFLFV